MMSRIKRLAESLLRGLVSLVKNLLTIFTLFSFAVLFVLFFMFMYEGDPIMCLMCLAGIYTFIHLNKVL